MNKTIRWARLPHAPENTLQKNRVTDAGWDIASADTVLVHPYSELNYAWEDFMSQEVAKIKLPELFEPSKSHILMQQRGVRLGLKYVVEYSTDQQAVWAALAKLGCTSIDHHAINSFRVGTRLAKETLMGVPGIVNVEEVNFIQRRVYKPLKIRTGIKVNPDDLCWFILALRSSATKYGVFQPHAIGVIDYSYDGELLVSMGSIHEYQIFARGERIAQLIPMQQGQYEFEEVAIAQLPVTNRGGFGSSGNGLDLQAA